MTVTEYSVLGVNPASSASLRRVSFSNTSTLTADLELPPRMTEFSREEDDEEEASRR